METSHILTQLWDYGWIYRDHVKIARASSDTAAIEHYVASPKFHGSFLPNYNDETGIHGPFVADRISATDFVPLKESEIGEYLKSVQISDAPGTDLAEQAKMMSHLRVAFKGGHNCYVLRRDERDHELFHDWGYVLFVFREFLFVSAERDAIMRFVIGYD